MQVIVKSHHTKVPAELRSMAVAKVERVRRFFDRITTLEIEFSESRNPRITRKHIVDVTLSTKAHVLRAEATGVDPASAVDAVVDKLERQVKRLKGKMIGREKGGARAAETIRIPSTRRPKRIAANHQVDSDADTKPASTLRVRKTGRFSVEPMTPREAVHHMDTSGDMFLPFVNAETDQISVVYRMDDGGYGLMQPAARRAKS